MNTNYLTKHNITDGFILKKDKSIYLIAYTNDDKHTLKSNNRDNREYYLIYFFTIFLSEKDINEVKRIFKEYLIPYCFKGYKYLDLKDYKPHTEKAKRFMELIKN